ncbi:PREDICTED: urease accessory protein D-like [Branchiostoma belcheri]|uniref:Urease accessory protein D-like n=1 Tax=Branchiostoma belcheri TaxID=7741 RepID=A0A6P5A6Q8_BRABE|nr:PREDICTED: urease accessory protein D-like [Branchiostoma belcheri]
MFSSTQKNMELASGKGEDKPETVIKTEKSQSRPEAKGRAVFQPTRENGQVVAVTNTVLQYTYPLKLLLPQNVSETKTCQWLYVITFGGGLVAGDNIQLDIELAEECTVVVTTQASTKVFHRVDDLVTCQTVEAKVGAGSLLVFLPDPVVCYKDAAYRQKQVFHLKQGSSLVLLDWYTSGRIARGECWEFQSYHSTNSIHLDDRLVFRDVVHLQDTPLLPVHQAMAQYNVVGMCVLIGPALSNLYNKLLKELGRSKPYGYKYNMEVVLSVSPLRFKKEEEEIHGAVVRVMAFTTTQVFTEMERILQELFPRLGGNPFENKY